MTTELLNSGPAIKQALSLHGRHAELAQITTLLRQADCQLVSLTGPAGIGKSVLAIAVARTASHPVAVVSFENSTAQTTEQAAGLIDQALAGMPAKAPCAGPSQPLLVLDSVDELSGCAQILTELLLAKPWLKVLVASRYPLEIAQEWVVKVRGLEFRTGGNGDTEMTQGLTCAAQMFVERVRTRLGSFDAEPHRRTINVICARLEGSPLGISLAADRVGHYSLVEIADRLTEDVDFLRTLNAAPSPRHASIRSAMDSCWRQLSTEQQNSFARLSMFVGGFSETAALTVTRCSRITLASLVEYAWLRLERTRTAVRYTVHPLLRRYGLEKLRQAGLQTDPLAHGIARAHAEFFVHLLCTQAEALRAVDDEAFHQIDLEHQNLMLAWTWLQTDRPAVELIHFVNTLHLYCVHRTHWREAAELLESALALPALPHEQRLKWQHLLNETRSRPERIHSAERRHPSRNALPETASLNARWLKGLAPPPRTQRRSLVQL